MKLPKNINEIFRRKDDYIQNHRDTFEKDVIKMQDELLDRVLKEIVPELDIQDGVIQNTKKNLNIIHELDRLYDDFASITQKEVVEKYGKSFARVDQLNTQYFKEIALNEVTKKRFDAVKSKTDSFMHTRIGVDTNGQLIKNGYLDQFIQDRTLLN